MSPPVRSIVLPSRACFARASAALLAGTCLALPRSRCLESMTQGWRIGATSRQGSGSPFHLAAAGTWSLRQSGGGPASAKPDFSGDWSFNKEKSRLQVEALAKLEQATLHIKHRDPAFILRRRFALGGRSNEVALELFADGREIVKREEERELHMVLEWEADALVFTTRIQGSPGEGTNVVRYRLADRGRVLEAEERFRGPGLSYDNFWVFDRAEPPEKPR